MTLFLLLNPKYYNVVGDVGGHFPTVYVPLWGKQKRKKKRRDLKRILLSYMKREVLADDIPEEVVTSVAETLKVTESRVMADWNAVIQSRKKQRSRTDEEMVLLFLAMSQ